MRSAVLFTAAFAAAVMASPLDSRDEVIVTDVDITYVTDIITVTAGQVPATPAAVQPAATSAAPAPAYQGGGWRKHRHSKKPKPSVAPAPSSSGPVGYPTVAPVPTSSAAPAPAPAPSSYSPPAPAPAPTTSAAPAPAPTTSAAPAPAPSAPASGYQQLVVAHHNVHRANYSSPDLAWDDDLAAAAQAIANTCVYAHSMNQNGLSYGQNIAAGSNDIGAIISDQFYNSEVNNYVAAIGGVYGNEPNMDEKVFDGYGHMSQVVWAGSTKVGCATSSGCSSLVNIDAGSNIPPIFTVCNYSPQGNMVGDFHNNIGNCKDQPTVKGADAVSA